MVIVLLFCDVRVYGDNLKCVLEFRARGMSSYFPPNAKFSAVEKLRKSDRPLRSPPLLEAVFNINRVAFPDINIARKL